MNHFCSHLPDVRISFECSEFHHTKYGSVRGQVLFKSTPCQSSLVFALSTLSWSVILLTLSAAREGCSSHLAISSYYQTPFLPAGWNYTPDSGTTRQPTNSESLISVVPAFLETFKAANYGRVIYIKTTPIKFTELKLGVKHCCVPRPTLGGYYQTQGTVLGNPVLHQFILSSGTGPGSVLNCVHYTKPEPVFQLFL